MPLKTNLHSKTGFTLIELMVTIAIVAIISSIGLVTYNIAQKLGRDYKRKQDLRAIATALTIYKQQNGRYPCSEAASSLQAQPWIKDYLTDTWKNSTCDNSKPPLDSNYINLLPVDPLNNSTYYYFYRGFDCGPFGRQYYVFGFLENTNDPDRISAKNPKNCNGSNMFPLYITQPNAFVIVGE